MPTLHGYPLPEADPAEPLMTDREYDLPAGPHVGHAAALCVPCSEGPASMVLARDDVSPLDLMASEPLDPSRLMEAGTEFDVETVRKLSALDRPIEPPPLVV